MPPYSGSTSLMVLTWVFLSSLSVCADTQLLTDAPPRGVVFPEVTPEDSLGTAAIGIGDFNGDSVDDVAIGAPISTFGGGTSAAYIVLGRSQFPQTFDLSSSGGIIKFATETLTFGTDIVPTGDIDGDGLSDIYIHQVFKTRKASHLWTLTCT